MSKCEWCGEDEAEFIRKGDEEVCEECMIEAIEGDKPENYETIEYYYQRRAEEKSRSDFIDEVISWASKADPDFIRLWELYLRRYLIDMGWDSAAIADFVNMGEGGFNYKLLHIETSVEDFYDDVHYCSDRMHIDRLLRCHIQYRTIVKGGDQ